MAKTTTPVVDEAGPFRNRVVDFKRAVPVGELVANPLNARLHPEHQMTALGESLTEVGWIDVVKVNVTTGKLIDGHARVERAMLEGESTPVPVLYVEITEAEERRALATLDPIGAMATFDPVLFGDLLAGSEEWGNATSQMLGDIAARYPVGLPEPVDIEPPDDFKEYGDDIDAGAHTCPQCGFEFD